ncbi:tape measure protein [Prosthecobacter dejongeii]|uniref:Tape measure domain-containing protein n=1 Tax=Prosthecobacter dejongeii TaxID=48465 RepID=A0A7W7YJ60_9BACT|nr:tape measure domain-containing protein [Prosthecobacter dejongeii]
MPDLSYTLGLDSSGFAGTVSSAIGVLGSLDLAINLVNRAARVMASSFEKAASMESVETAIGTILKDANLTKDVMSELKRIGAETPFEMSDLAPAARALLGAGTAAKDLGKQIKMLGDVASGADTDLGGLVSIFNQIRGKGTLATEEFLQLAERGVAGLREEIAKFKGINVNEVGDALTKGAVSAKDFENILGRMTGNGGAYFASMSRQSETFAGKLSTLSDAWSSLQVAFAAPINEALKPIMDDLTSLGGIIEPVFAAVGGQVAEVISSFREFILQINEGAGGVDALTSSFGDLLGTVDELIKIPFGAIADGMPELGMALLTALLPALQMLDAKLGAIVLHFASDMANGMADVLRAMGDETWMDFGAFTAAADTLSGTASNLEKGAGREELRADSVQLKSGFDPAKALLNEGMRDILDGLVSRGRAFNQGMTGGAEALPDVSVSEDLFTRLANAAAPGIAQPFADAGMQSSSPQDVQQSLVRLDAILNELQRLNTF